MSTLLDLIILHMCRIHANGGSKCLVLKGHGWSGSADFFKLEQDCLV